MWSISSRVRYATITSTKNFCRNLHDVFLSSFLIDLTRFKEILVVRVFYTMDIRTLLTETKSFPPKRKSESLGDTPLLSEPPNSSHIYVTVSTNMSKNVKFTLNNTSQSLNLTISPTDPPSAITSTVKDFFALHSCGVSFTDCKGNVLIITPENLVDDMEVLVNQVGVEGENGVVGNNKKKRKSTLSSRKNSGKKVTMEKDIVKKGEEQEGVVVMEKEQAEKRERAFSSDVSIDNILDSSRRRLTKFSSQVQVPETVVTNA